MKPFITILEVIAKLHGSKKSMILNPLERQRNALPYCTDGCLPKRAGEKGQSREGSKGRFLASKSFAIASFALVSLFSSTRLEAYVLSKMTGSGAQQAVQESQWQNWAFAGTALFTAAAGIVLVSMDNGSHAH